MPTITRICIKTALIYVLFGMLMSTLWLIHLAWPLYPLLAHFRPTALHLIVVGWLTQLIFGVALWMFPAWSKDQPRGPSVSAWLCYGLLNAGLLLRLVVEPLNSSQPTVELGWLLAASAIMQVTAILVFISLVWTRVRTKTGRRS